MSRAVRNIINANIKQNGRQEITGNLLNGVLNAMVTDYEQQGEDFSKKVLKVNIKELLSDYADSILELSQKYGMILLLDEDDSGNLVATILPTRDDGYPWVYEWVEGWKIVDAPSGFSFDWQDASFRDLLEYFDSDSSPIANQSFVNSKIVEVLTVILADYYTKEEADVEFAPMDEFKDVQRRVDGITNEDGITYIDGNSIDAIVDGINDLQREFDKAVVFVDDTALVRTTAPQGLLPQLASKAAMYVVLQHETHSVLYRIFFTYGKVLLLYQDKILVGNSISTTTTTTWNQLVTWMLANYNEVTTKNEVVLLSGNQAIGGVKEFESEAMFDSGIDMQSSRIKSLADPQDIADAVNKNYVDGIANDTMTIAEVDALFE